MSTHQPERPSSGAPGLLLAASLAVTLTLLLPLSASSLFGSPLSATAPPGAGAPSKSSSIRSSPLAPTTVGSAQLTEATSSLERGAGPARGADLTCSNPSGDGAVNCRMTSTSLPPLGWSPVGSPLGRSAVTMTYDVADGYVVLFSDGSSSVVTGDTWIFQGGHWTELSPPVAPSPRLGAYMAYDSRDGYVLLFGGWGGNSGPSEYGDTWAFSGGSWHLIIPQSSCVGSGGTLPCPSPRDSGSMADDPGDAMVLLFGGYGGLGDSWGYGGGSWVNIIPLTSCTSNGGSMACPSPRDGAPMAWDPALGGDVLFGGSGPLNDTWLFRAGSWQQLIAPTACTPVSGPTPCPSAREESSLSYDASDGYLLMFGGYNGSADLSDSWAFYAGSWHPLPAASGCRLCPPTRSGAGLAYDPALGGVLMFGGYPYRGDSWIFTGGSWTTVVMAQTPGPRWDASMAWDPLDQQVLLFGGFGSNGSAVGDTWAFANGGWTELYTVGSCASSACPSPRAGAALAWDGADREMLLFGGTRGGAAGYLRDTWAFSSGSWSLLIASSSCTSTTCPSARANASIVWDDVGQRVLLFGGIGTSYDNDTWAFSQGSWSEILSNSQCMSRPCPSPREGAGTATGPLPSGGLVVFGGTTASGATNDTWRFSGSSWTVLWSASQCLSAPCPSPRSGPAMALDPNTGAVALFGGVSGTRSLSDTWVLNGGNWSSVRLYGPSGRGFSTMAYDGTGRTLLLTGGTSSYGAPSDTWALSSPLTVFVPTANPSSPDVGQSVVFDDMATGAGAASASFTWQGLPPGCVAPTNGASMLSCTPTVPGTYFVSTVVVPGNGLAGVTGAFLQLVVNSDPVVTISSPTSTFDLGSNLSIGANASGGTGLFTRFLWTGLPPDCSTAASSSPLVTCHLLNRSDLGVWQVSVSAWDSSGFNATSPSLALKVTIAPWSVSVLLSPASIDLSQYVIIGTKVAGFLGSLSYNWNGLPPGCTGSIGSLLCSPSTAGTYPISVVVSNATQGSVASSSATLTVYPGLVVPTLAASAENQSLGQQLILQASETGGDAPYSFVWSGLPAGCSTASGALIACTPALAGTYTVQALATDALGSLSPPATMSLRVNASATGVLLTASRTTLDLGQSIAFDVTVFGGTTAASIQWSGVPSGCSPSGASFVCRPSSTGTFMVVAQASAPPAAPLISNVVTVTVFPALSSAQLLTSVGALPTGSPLMLSASISGGEGPYTYLWTGLPSGCVAADTPTVTCVVSVPGSFTPSVMAADQAGESSNASGSVLVSPATSHPTSEAGNTTATFDWLEVALVVVAIVLAALLFLLLLRERGKSPSPPRKDTRTPPPGNAPGSAELEESAAPRENVSPPSRNAAVPTPNPPAPPPAVTSGRSTSGTSQSPGGSYRAVPLTSRYPPRLGPSPASAPVRPSGFSTWRSPDPVAEGNRASLD